MPFFNVNKQLMVYSNGGHLAQRAFGTEGIWFWRAFGRGHLEQRAFGPRAFFGGLLDRGHFFRRAFGPRAYFGGLLDRGHFLEGNWNYIGLILERVLYYTML